MVPDGASPARWIRFGGTFCTALDRRMGMKILVREEADGERWLENGALGPRDAGKHPTHRLDPHRPVLPARVVNLTVRTVDGRLPPREDWSDDRDRR